MKLFFFTLSPAALSVAGVSEMWLAWRQLAFTPWRLFAAMAGVVFAIVLMLIQIGFYFAMIDSATNIQRNLVSQLVVIPSAFEYFGSDHAFSRARLMQALAVADVEDVTPLYLSTCSFRNVDTGDVRSIQCLAVDPSQKPLQLPSLDWQWEKLKLTGHILFDRKSLQAYFGDVARKYEAAGPFAGEVQGARTTIDGLFDLGTSFVAFGNVLMGAQTYFAILPNASPDQVNVGLVRLKREANALTTRDNLTELLSGGDVVVMTRDEFIQREIDYWNSTAAVGLLFAVGALMGFIVGSVIVYQILYTNVSDHLAEYATLKAMGFSQLSFILLVLTQSVYLSVIGFVPGLLISIALYAWIAQSTGYAMPMTISKGAGVFFATVLMCLVAGLLAIRRLKSADPAELFQ